MRLPSLPRCSLRPGQLQLFAHHLDPPQLLHFVRDALRVSRRAVLINDLIGIHCTLPWSMPVSSNAYVHFASRRPGIRAPGVYSG